MKLAPKIVLGYVLSASLVIVVALASYQALESVKRQHETVVKAVMPNLEALQQIEASGLRILAITNELIWMHATSPQILGGREWGEEWAELQLEAIAPYDQAVARYRAIAERFVAHEIIFVELIEEWGERLKSTSLLLVELETTGSTAAELNHVRKQLEAVERGFLLSIEAAKAHESQELKLESENLQAVLLEVENTVVLGSALAFVLAVSLGMVFARSLTRPIIQLKEAAVALGSGNLKARVNIRSRDEVGTLARSFNAMGEALGKTTTVFENTSEGVIITDAGGRIIAVNQAFTDITGYPESEVLGSLPSILKSERHNQAFFEGMWRQLLEAGVWQGELWNRRKNGELFPTWGSIRAIREESGELSHFISVFSDITSLKQSQEKLDYLAYHDPLTQLPNRLLFEDRLGQALRHARRHRQQVALLFIDLDRFKNINDSLGHPIGDNLLITVANRLSRLVRQEDTVARVGGDEFVVVIESANRSQEVAALARKLVEAFHRPLVFGEADQPLKLHVTLSIGISVFPTDGEDVPTLVKNADAALYRAKEEGRNGFQFYTAELTATVFERLALETALRVAVKEDRLVLHYQPIVSLTSGEVVGAEALLRWRHPEYGLVEPDKFIALAEDTGLISGIGAWVVQEACRQARQWLDKGYPLHNVAVNVSGLQIQRGHYVDVVTEALEQSGLEGSHLVLEITENVIMQNTDRVIEVLTELKQLGTCIAIDDFGTGYSSLSYLKLLPIDKLKIDQSFVRDITLGRSDRAIVRAVLALANSLRLKVVAEGIESKEQEALLRRLGCDQGQGYRYSRPVTAEAFETILAGRTPLTHC